MTSSGTPTVPAVLYPTGNPVINVDDTVVIVYETPWTQGANLSVFCYDTPATTTSYWDWWAWNPIHESGTYTWAYVGHDFVGYVAQYPTPCWFFLWPYVASQGKGVTGGNFTLASSSGAIKTWEASTTIAVYSATGTSSVTTATTTSSNTASATSPPVSPAPASSAAAYTQSSPGLSTGAKIGIAVGAAAAGLFVLGALMYIIWMHRRLARASRSTNQMPEPEMVYRQGGPPGFGQEYGRSPSGFQDGGLGGLIPVHEKSTEPGLGGLIPVHEKGTEPSHG